MIKYLVAGMLAVSLAACSSDSSDSGTGGPSVPPSGNNNGGNNTTDGNNAGGGTAISSGALPGVWFGSNHYGSTVTIIDANQNLYSLSADGNGFYETGFGPASGNVEYYIHRIGENTAFSGNNFTLVGDPQLPDTRQYSFTVVNEGQQLDNSGALGTFSLTRATENDVQLITVADVVGDWVVRTSYCDTCELTLTMSFGADGSVTGATVDGTSAPNTLTGTIASASGSNQYLGVSFVWLENNFAGVAYKDPNDPTRLVLNVEGPVGEETRTLTGSMVRQ